MSITYGSIISEVSTTSSSTSTRSDIENGQVDYVAELLMEFDVSGLVESFDFNFKQIRTIDEDAELTPLGDSTIGESQLSESFYTKFINNTYKTGITPYKISVYSEGFAVDYILGWAHGEIERPEFRRKNVRTTDFTSQSYSVTHSQEEVEAIKNKYDKGTFADNFSSFVAAASKNVYNRMTINTNQGLEFQKNKIGKIDSKKASSVDTPTQSVTISSVGSTASISTGGY